jgi:hypothetical protein
MFAAILALSACATDQGQEAGGDNQPVSQILSAQELDTYLRTTPSSPLDRLPAAAKQSFIASLVFTEDGLASYSYTELETLSPAEIYQILSLFGAERTSSMVKAPASGDSPRPATQQSAPADYKNYWCSGRATCEEALGKICMSSC